MKEIVSMNLPTFEDFKSNALARGCSEVLVREWTPNQEVDEHSHPFKAEALIVEGEMWLIVGADAQHLVLGDTFNLEPHVLHSEKYGPQGAIYWVARTNT